MIKEYIDTYYNQDYIYKEIKTYFKIEDFYRRAAIDRAKKIMPAAWEQLLWSLLDYRLLSNLLYIRVNLNKPIIGGKPDNTQLDERGVRDNMSDTIKVATRKGIITFSGHAYGIAFDFNVTGMISEDVRKWVKTQNTLIPFKCRFEHLINGVPIGWIHMDVAYYSSNPHISFFNIQL